MNGTQPHMKTYCELHISVNQQRIDPNDMWIIQSGKSLIILFTAVSLIGVMSVKYSNYGYM